MTPARAKKLALWLGEIFPSLNPEQLKEFALEFNRHRGIEIVRGVRAFAREHEFATFSGITEAIRGEERKRRARREAAAKRDESALKLERLADQHIAGLSLIELYEIRESLLIKLPAQLAERIRKKDPADPEHRRAHLSGSQMVRAFVKSMIKAQSQPEPEHGNSSSPAAI